MAYSILHLRPVFERLGGLHASMVHIAGSKGKGSTATLVAHGLRFYGHKVRLFTSPAVRNECESVWIDGQAIEPELLQKFRHTVMAAAKAEALVLSDFEVLTLAAFCAFNAAACDFAVVECGMGGAHDSTNIVPHKRIAVLTHVELEHTAELGETLTAITHEKMGIARPQTPLITLADQAPEVLTALANSPLELHWAKPQVLGMHHPSAVGLARRVLELLDCPFTPELEANLRAVQLPGRFEIRELQTDHGAPLTVILDGAHTPDSVHDFLTRLEAWRAAHHAPEAVFGLHFLKDKSPDLVKAFPVERSVWLELPSEPRAGQKPELWTAMSVSSFVSTLRDASEPTLAVLCGSFRLVHAAILELEKL